VEVAPEDAAQVEVAPEDAATEDAAWTCPFCSYEVDHAVARCPDCAAIATLDLDAIDANVGANTRQLKYAAEHYTKILADGDDVSGFYLGLAYLNLRRSYDAQLALEHYLANHPGDEEVKSAIAAIAQRKLILAVDDSATVRSVVSDALERAHFRCATACNGVDAVGFLRGEARPDFILMDVSMPLMDGYQLCKVIKQMAHLKNVPVVMLSGNDGFVDKVKGRMAGASDYLLKPFDQKTLLAVIQRLLGGRNN
jgi:twitching motility two-component system response regulator PilG